MTQAQNKGAAGLCIGTDRFYLRREAATLTRCRLWIESCYPLLRSCPWTPLILILDEPTASLDMAATEIVVRIIEAFLSVGRLWIAATHDVGFAARCFERLVILHRGKIADEGPHPPDIQPAMICWQTRRWSRQPSACLPGLVTCHAHC